MQFMKYELFTYMSGGKRDMSRSYDIEDFAYKATCLITLDWETTFQILAYASWESGVTQAIEHAISDHYGTPHWRTWAVFQLKRKFPLITDAEGITVGYAASLPDNSAVMWVGPDARLEPK